MTKINLILLGDGSVGKTSMIKMYAEKKFQSQHMATLGLDFVTKTYKPKNFDKEMQVKIWDTAGQERFKSLTVTFYKQSQGMIICFDLTKRKTFESVRSWVLATNKHCGENIATMLVGNKCDLEEDRVVSRDEAE